MRRGLELLVLAGALSACDNRYDYYDFKKELGEETVSFHESYLPVVYHVNTLSVKSSEGMLIKYVDNKGSDLQIDYIEVKKSGQNSTYSRETPVGAPVVSQGQKRFDGYIKLIKEQKVAEGLADISGVHVL